MNIDSSEGYTVGCEGYPPEYNGIFKVKAFDVKGKKEIYTRMVFKDGKWAANPEYYRIFEWRRDG